MKIKDLEIFYENNDIEIFYDLFEEDEDHKIYLENRYVFIPYLNIDVYYGYYESYYEDTEDFELDFDFYMFFDSNTKEHVYEEQGSSLEVCIYNYSRNKNYDINCIEDVEVLDCQIDFKEML